MALDCVGAEREFGEVNLSPIEVLDVDPCDIDQIPASGRDRRARARVDEHAAVLAAVRRVGRRLLNEEPIDGHPGHENVIDVDGRVLGDGAELDLEDRVIGAGRAHYEQEKPCQDG